MDSAHEHADRADCATVSAGLSMAFQADMHGSQGEISKAEACAFRALDLVTGGADGETDRLAFVAFVAHAVALDSGNRRLAVQASALPLDRVISTRQRVYAHAAAAIAAFLVDDWDEARARLLGALETCALPEVRHLVGLPIGLWIDLSMSRDDRPAVEHGLLQIRALPSRLSNRLVRAPEIRARAWLAVREGRLKDALDLLGKLCAAPSTSRQHAISRLDAAWLACEAGLDLKADRLIEAAGRWTKGSPLGLVVQARRHLLGGSGDRAAEAWSQARCRWPARWPDRWQALQAQATSFSRPITGGAGGRTLPSVELRRQLCGG